MTEQETRELIEQLRTADVGGIAGPLMDEAADALESTLWKPIADIPDKLKDGRLVILHGTWRGKNVGPVFGEYSDWLKRWNYNALPILPTHYREITSPEQEK